MRDGTDAQHKCPPATELSNRGTNNTKQSIVFQNGIVADDVDELIGVVNSWQLPCGAYYGGALALLPLRLMPQAV